MVCFQFSCTWKWTWRSSRRTKKVNSQTSISEQCSGASIWSSKACYTSCWPSHCIGQHGVFQIQLYLKVNLAEFSANKKIEFSNFKLQAMQRSKYLAKQGLLYIMLTLALRRSTWCVSNSVVLESELGGVLGEQKKWILKLPSPSNAAEQVFGQARLAIHHVDPRIA